MPEHGNHADYDVDVIVVGAGPIGLTTACALGHHGVKFRLFEEKPKPKPYSRANNVWARPQELLDSIGVRAALAEKSYLIEKQTVLLDGRPLDQVPLDKVKSPFPKVFYSGQDVIETTLSEQVAKTGGAVERGRRIVDIQPDEHGVSVSVIPLNEDGEPDGQAEQLRCRYLVGADGDKGGVRKAAGLDFEMEERFEGRANRSIDARLTWRRSTDCDQLWFFVYHNGFAGVLPVWGGYHRIFFLEDDTGMPDRDPTLEEMQQHARDVTRDETLTLSDPIWFSHNRFQYGVAPHHAAGRVFLAGDAGHHTLPIGGQGMNAGMTDGIGLAWRLAMALEGSAGDAVLGSYDGERHGQHADLSDNQATGMRRLVYRNRAEDLALDVAGNVVPDLGSKLFGSNDLQQLSVSYRKSLLSEDHLVGLRELVRTDAPHAGDRAPDADVTAADGTTPSLFSFIYNPDGRSWGWSLLAFDGRDAAARQDLLAAVEAAAPWDFVRPRLVLAAPAGPDIGGGEVTVLSDFDEGAHAAYGLDGLPALILVRPDGHIAFRGPANRPELLRAYCEKVFAAPDRPA